MRHAPKKVPPPTSDGHEGRLFPPERFFNRGRFSPRRAWPQTIFSKYFKVFLLIFWGTPILAYLKLIYEAGAALSDGLPLRGAGGFLAP